LTKYSDFEECLAKQKNTYLQDHYNRHKEQIGIAAYRDRGIDRVRGDRESERVLQEREGERQQRYVSEPVRRKYLNS
jgi:hypothetical protein